MNVFKEYNYIILTMALTLLIMIFYVVGVEKIDIAQIKEMYFNFQHMEGGNEDIIVSKIISLSISSFFLIRYLLSFVLFKRFISSMRYQSISRYFVFFGFKIPVYFQKFKYYIEVDGELFDKYIERNKFTKSKDQINEIFINKLNYQDMYFGFKLNLLLAIIFGLIFIIL